MVSTKSTVQKVLDHLPDDCTMDQFLDRLFVINLIEQRLNDLEQNPDETYTTGQVREMMSKWRVK